jgi:hypothetical protein
MIDSSISWVDLVIVIAVAFSVLAGLSQGFFRSVCSLGGLILGLAIAEWNYPTVAAPLKPLVHDQQVANILGFILIAVLIMAIAAVLGAVLARTFKSIGLAASSASFRACCWSASPSWSRWPSLPRRTGCWRPGCPATSLPSFT